VTASVAARALRRFMEMRSRGEDVTREAIEADLAARDERDAARAVAPCARPKVRPSSTPRPCRPKSPSRRPSPSSKNRPSFKSKREPDRPLARLRIPMLRLKPGHVGPFFSCVVNAPQSMRRTAMDHPPPRTLSPDTFRRRARASGSNCRCGATTALSARPSCSRT
jgi:hypothetical protein